jgi:hypothetical protein
MKWRAHLDIAAAELRRLAGDRQTEAGEHRMVLGNNVRRPM